MWLRFGQESRNPSRLFCDSSMTSPRAGRELATAFPEAHNILLLMSLRSDYLRVNCAFRSVRFLRIGI
jgi:hypothetical protein